jgi:hypothetical protein
VRSWIVDDGTSNPQAGELIDPLARELVTPPR